MIPPGIPTEMAGLSLVLCGSVGVVTSAIIAGVGLAASLATTGLALSKGAPNYPKPPPPVPPPPPPPIPKPAILPEPPKEVEADRAVAGERRKRAQRFGVAQTLISSPLGGVSGAQPGGKSLLGGG